MSAEPRTPTTSGAQNTGAATITRILRLLEEKCPRCEEGDVFAKRGKIGSSPADFFANTEHLSLPQELRAGTRAVLHEDA